MSERTIWKFPFAISSCFDIEMPKGAETVHVEAQQGVPAIWALVDPKAPTETRTFYVFGTGHAIPNGFGWYATIQLPPFVWHIFERTDA
jgi:hypothetical protein